MSDGVYFVDLDRQIQYWNEGAVRLTGYRAEGVLGRRCPDGLLCHVDRAGRNLCHDGCPVTACVKEGIRQTAQIYLRHKQGRCIPLAVRVEPMLAEDGSVVGAVEIFSDDSVQSTARRNIADMQRLAFLDQLTQLPNRRFAEMSLHTALAEYKVHRDAFGVLIIDLDRFKAINDTFGHATGDLALQQVARSLVSALRAIDIVGRWGGDEFIALVRHVNTENLRQLAERCFALVAHHDFQLRW